MNLKMERGFILFVHSWTLFIILQKTGLKFCLWLEFAKLVLITKNCQFATWEFFFSLMDRLCNLEEFFLIIILFTIWQKNFKVFNYVLVHMMCYQQVSKSSNSPTPVLIYAKIAHSSKRDLTSKVWAHSDIL